MPRRGENIYKRKDGRWEARYVKEIKADGKKLYGSVYGKSYNEVKLKRQLYITEPHKTTCNSINISVSELMNEWLFSIKGQVKPNTYQKYEGITRNHITYEIGNYSVRLITINNITLFTNSLISKGLSTKTINDILTILSLALQYAYMKYEIVTPEIKHLKEGKREMRVLSVLEQQKLTNYLNTDMDIFKFGILLTLYTGIRLGELCALQWEDVNSKYIAINKTMTRIKINGKTEISIGTPKTECSNRILPTPQCLLPLIKKYRSTGYVLSTDELKFVEPRLMQFKFERMIRECGLSKTNFHALRHTFATRCVEAGVDAKTLSEMLGHSDVRTTLNKYVHSSFELKQRSMAQFESSLIS